MITSRLSIQIIFALAALYGIYEIYINKSVFSRLILIVQVVSLVVFFVPFEEGLSWSLWIFTFSLFMVVGYPMLMKGINPGVKGLILGIAGPMLLLHLFQLNHWPGANIIGFGVIIPLVLYFFLLMNSKSGIRNEIGFLTIITADALVEFMLHLGRF